MQGNCDVQRVIEFPVVDIEEIGKFISTGKINPVEIGSTGVDDIQEGQRECRNGAGLHPAFTDWSKFDQGQIWEVYQGLVNGVDVSTFFNPKLSAIEMCAIRLAAE